ncbi:hypothetical protein [Candidatus Poriferisodalis sp.]
MHKHASAAQIDAVAEGDPDYLAIAPIRAAALADSRIIETLLLLPKA